MIINILNNHLQKIAVVDNYTSLIWCKRYFDVGALDLEIEATAETLAIFKKGYFITRDDDDAIFRIEALELDTTQDRNNSLIVGAYDCKKILHQRIVWQQVNFYGTVEDYIRRLITQNIVSPSMGARRITNFFLKTAKGYTEMINEQVTYDVVGEKIIELCKNYNYGCKVTLENGRFLFDLYKGVDRSIDQDTNPHVVFSPDNENLVSSKYNTDISDFKNAALVGGEGEGFERKTRTIGSAAGLDRFEMFIDASSLSRNEGTEEEIDLPTYYENLIAEGKDKLAEQTVTTSFEGEVDAQSYKYKTDYDLGDIVTIKNEYGISVNARITEIIETWDNEGYTIEPVFEYMEAIEDEEVDGALLTENGVMMLTESGSPLLTENAPASSSGVKISELEPVDTLFDGCCFPIVQNGVTKKVTKATLQEEVLPEFEIDSNGDLIAIIGGDDNEQN